MRPLVFVTICTTIAVFDPVPFWVIEHDWVMPPVLMHFATFWLLEAAATWTTGPLPGVPWKEFVPPAAATWTTGRDVDVHVQPFPGQAAPA